MLFPYTLGMQLTWGSNAGVPSIKVTDQSHFPESPASLEAPQSHAKQDACQPILPLHL